MIYAILFVVSVLGTYFVRWYSNKKLILDVPNERSSHTVATPRGGGLAIIITFYIGLFYFQEQVDSKLFSALLWAIPIAIISLIDDIYTLSSNIRLSVQGLVSILALYSLGGVNEIDFVLFRLDGVWLNIIAFISILWLTNLYNFLDGINGYAGAEAVTVGLGIFILFHNPLGIVIIMANLGFLLFNWGKASIFMGDVGSATLGFIFAIFIFYDTSHGNIYIWMILLSLFWFDATFTLIRRYLNKEKLTQAHKKHAYQRLVQSGWGHSKVVTVALIFNLVFLLTLYLFNMLLVVFIVNILLMSIIMKLIDKRKSFND